jgi:hypothetical protein
MESLRSIRLNILIGVRIAGREMRRAVEKRAHALHESSDPSAIPWVKRGQAARDPRRVSPINLRLSRHAMRADR